MGDVNQDGQINIIDIILMMQYIVGFNRLTNFNALYADVYPDGSLNMYDVLMLAQYLNGIREYLP